MAVSYDEIVAEARELLSEDGENEEYDRALAELIARCFPEKGMPTDERAMEVMEDIMT